MSIISKKEVELALKLLNVAKHDGEYRIKGFKLEFTKIWDKECITLNGKIPLPLAESIDKNRKQLSIWYGTDCYHSSTIIENARSMVRCQMIQHHGLDIDAAYEFEKQLPVEKLYITQIATDSIDGLTFIIEKVRETNIINEWAIGNN